MGQQAYFAGEDGARFSLFSRAFSRVLTEKSDLITLKDVNRALQIELDGLSRKYRKPAQKIKVRGDMDAYDEMFQIRPENETQALTQVRRLAPREFDVGLKQRLGVRVLAVSFDRQILAAGGHSGRVHLSQFLPQGRKFIRKAEIQFSRGALLAGLNGCILAMDFSPAERILAVGGQSDTVKIFDLSLVSAPRLASQPKNRYTNHTRVVRFSRDGKLLLIGTDEGLVSLWNTGDAWNPSPRSRLAKRERGVRAADFDPTGAFLAIGGRDTQVVLWNVRDPDHPVPVTMLSGHGEMLRGVAFRHRGQVLATVSADGQVILWDLTDVEAPATVSSFRTDQRALSLSWSPDGTLLAIGLDQGGVELWAVINPGRPERVSLLARHKDGVRAVCFTAADGILATADRKGEVIQWRL
jgi:WD40 repeat protein